MILPEILSFDESTESLDSFLKRAYHILDHDINHSGLKWAPANSLVKIRKQPKGRYGLPGGFIHVVSTGSGSDMQRPISIERARFVPWIGPVIRAFNDAYIHGRDGAQVHWWVSSRQVRSSKTIRYCVATKDFDYVVFVDQRQGKGVSLVTAYPVEALHRRKKFERECAKYWKSES